MDKTTHPPRGQAAELFEKAWSQALTAVSTAEEEASKVVARLGAAAGWSHEEAKKQVRELTERLINQRRALEREVEEGVRRALAAVRLPRRDQLQAVSERLDRLSQRIDRLSRRS